jgi:hypothetical protein
MPGSLQLAQPATVMPYSLCRAFAESREFPVDESGPYVDGRSQRAVSGTVGRRAWQLTKALTLVQWELLVDFYGERRGAAEPFYWYPLAAHHDATGESSTGRFTVRFDGYLARTFALGLQSASLRLIQVS